MISSLFSTAYLPSTLWMVLAGRAQDINIELGETYPKQTYRNRCEIAMPQGKMGLSIPIKKPYGSKSKSYDILVDNDKPWQRHHLRSIETAYSSSPFYMYYIDELKDLLHEQHELLYQLNAKLIQWLMDNLGIEGILTHSKDFSKPNSLSKNDYRFAIHPKKDSTILPDQEKWPTYQQVFANTYAFIPRLSSIDLLFNMGPEAPYYLQQISIQ